MGKRKVVIKKSVAESIAEISWFIESKGLVATAEKYADDIYDFILDLADTKESFPICRDPKKSIYGYKCVSFRKKYTIIFIETQTEIIVSELIPSKLLHW
jgi:hypothetical protein